jgi:hypothetical protein
MLSIELRRYFASLGARLLVRTDPKGTATRLALREDARGSYFELLVPSLARKNVAVLATRPRDKRLLLQLTHGGEQTHLVVQGKRPQGGPTQWSITTLAPAQAQAVVAQLPQVDAAGASAHV